MVAGADDGDLTGLREHGLLGRRYWWVNQGQTHREEIAGGFMWSPKFNRGPNGPSRSPFYDNMARVQVGDLVLSYWGSQIRAVGVATGEAVSARKPTFQSGDPGWDADGWYVPVRFEPVPHPVAPRDRIDEIRPLLPTRYSPINRTGGGQTAYLFEISPALAWYLLDWSGSVAAGQPQQGGGMNSTELSDVEAVFLDLGATERTVVQSVRRGQEQFKRNVYRYERACRVTGTVDRDHLRASHIKPWRDSTGTERLDGCNGLLLAPHIDHLFDQGWISFGDDGEMLTSRHLERRILVDWSIPALVKTSPFNRHQRGYLAHHRDFVFRR